MPQHTAYPERRYLVLPLITLQPDGRYLGDFEIYEGAVTGVPLHRDDSAHQSHATSMAARSAMQRAATDWIDEHPL